MSRVEPRGQHQGFLGAAGGTDFCGLSRRMDRSLDAGGGGGDLSARAGDRPVQLSSLSICRERGKRAMCSMFPLYGDLVSVLPALEQGQTSANTRC